MMNMYRRSCHSNSATDSDTACHAFERNTNSVRSTAATKEHMWASRLAFKKTNNKKWRPAFNLLVSHNWTSRVWESDNLPIVTYRMDTDNYPWAANICLHIETHMFHILWIPAACTKYVVLFFCVVIYMGMTRRQQKWMHTQGETKECDYKHGKARCRYIGVWTRKQRAFMYANSMGQRHWREHAHTSGRIQRAASCATLWKLVESDGARPNAFDSIGGNAIESEMAWSETHSWISLIGISK